MEDEIDLTSQPASALHSVRPLRFEDFAERRKIVERESPRLVVLRGCPSLDKHLAVLPIDLVPPYSERFSRSPIAAALIPHEKSENLFPPHAPHPHWYQLLANRMDIGNVNPSENKLSIITFNYDRSLEHYLFKIIETRCGRGHDDALTQLRQLEIQHVHGVLGHYAPHGEEGRPYSSDANASVVAAAGQGIHIVSDPLEEFVEARKLLEAAERIYFLGFGFHPENVRHLAAFQERRWVQGRDVIVGGTTLGFTRDQWILVENDILNENFTIGYHTQGIHQFLDQAGRLE